MPIEVRGHLIVSPFTFVCEGKLYRSSNAKGWTNIQDQFGYSVFGRYQHAWRVRNVPCTANRDGELTRGFRAALMRQIGLNYTQIDSYISDQIKRGNQVLVEGNSVKVYNGQTTVKVSGFSNGGTSTPTPPAPAPVKVKKSKEEGMAQHFKMLRSKGVPPGDEQTFHTWYNQNPKLSNNKPLADAIALWKSLVNDEPIAQPEPEVITAPEPAPVAEPVTKAKKAAAKVDIAKSAISKGYRLRGVPEDRLQEYHDWFMERVHQYSGVKLSDVVADWKAAVGLTDAPTESAHYDIPVPQLCLPAPSPESLAADRAKKEQSAKATRKYRERKQRERKKRELVEERGHEEDVPFYGRRRRNQAQFRADVAQNCGYRCVYTFASEIRCDAAHLVPHARKGGASFKNGILLRKDLHVLFDEGHCAIEPDTLQLWFSEDILASDPDLHHYQAMAMRPTDKPIKRDNLTARWDAFLEKYMS